MSRFNFTKQNSEVTYHSGSMMYKDDPTFVTYETYYVISRYGCSTREVSLYKDSKDDKWTGDIIEFGEWYDLDDEDVAEVINFIKEIGKWNG